MLLLTSLSEKEVEHLARPIDFKSSMEILLYLFVYPLEDVMINFMCQLDWSLVPILNVISGYVCEGVSR